MPIPKCATGPGFSCKLDDFENFVKERIGDVDFVKQCGVNSTYPSELTFYWDYKNVTYNAPLGDF